MEKLSVLIRAASWPAYCCVACCNLGMSRVQARTDGGVFCTLSRSALLSYVSCAMHVSPNLLSRQKTWFAKLDVVAFLSLTKISTVIACSGGT